VGSLNQVRTETCRRLLLALALPLINFAGARDVAFKVTARAPPPTRTEVRPRGPAPARGGHGGPQRGGRGGAARPAPRRTEKKEEVDLDAELAAYASKR
jgi:hypothetical protein